jgi:hypothetical protein
VSFPVGPAAVPENAFRSFLGQVVGTSLRTVLGSSWDIVSWSPRGIISIPIVFRTFLGQVLGSSLKVVLGCVWDLVPWRFCLVPYLFPGPH